MGTRPPLSLPALLSRGTSGWKAWHESGRRRSFWERIRSHLTEALCAGLLRSGSAGRARGGCHTHPRGPQERLAGWNCPTREDEGRTGHPARAGDLPKPGRALHPHGNGSRRTFSTLANTGMTGPVEPCWAWKDIFDFFCIHWDGWEDAAVTDGVGDEEQEVTADDLLCHKHPAREEQVTKSTEQSTK